MAGTSPASRSATRRAGIALVRAAVIGKLAPAARAVARRRDAYHRDLWLTAAADLGLSARSTGGSTVRVELGADEALTIGRGGSSIEDAVALERAGDKTLVLDRLDRLHVPTPEHVVVTLAHLEPAHELLAHGPCVVKPARDTSAGRGVTTGVHDLDGLRTAAVAAAAAGSRAGRGTRAGSVLRRLVAKYHDIARVPLLVERQVAGDNYRLLYLDGELVDAVRRAVPYVVGDGRSTLRALLARSTAARGTDPIERGGGVVTVDHDLRNTLTDAGLTLSAVPGRGTVVPLKTAVNEGAIADQAPVRDHLCADIVAQGATAAAAVGGRLVGVDVITPDPMVSLRRAGGVVLEVNTTPGLAYHYHGRPGGVDVVRVVLQRLHAAHTGAGTATS